MSPVWCLSGFAGIFILIGVWLGIRRRRLTRDLLNGGAWIHWQYDAATWSEFSQRDAQQATVAFGRLPTRVLVILSIIPIASVIGALIGWLGGDVWRGAVALAGLASIVAVCVLIVLGIVSASQRIGGQRLAQRRAIAPSDVYINRDGVWESGRYEEFYSDTEVTLVNGALPMLEFRGYTENKGFRQLSSTVRVPVPTGKNAEAEAFIERFKPHAPMKQASI